MRSPSIDWLHARLNKQIKVFAAFLGIPELYFIIKSCRLKPYDYIFKNRIYKTKLQKWWFDEHGNSLVIKNKKPFIVYNDLRLDRDIGTDLYYNLSLNKVAKISKLMYLISGKDEDLFQRCYLLSFLGIDNYFRSYLYWYGEWKQVSPMLLGLDNLKLISKNLKSSYKKNKKGSRVLPCIEGETWLYSLSEKNEKFLSMLKKEHEIIYNVIKE